MIASTGMVRHPPIVGGAVEAYVDDIVSMFAKGQGYSVSVVSDFRQLSHHQPGVDHVNVYSPVDRFPLRPIAGALGHVVAGSFVAFAVNRYVRGARTPGAPIILHLNEEVSAEILTRVLPRVPKVFTLHNPPPGLSVLSSTQSDRTLRGLNFRVLLRFCLPRMEAVIALSSRIREYLCTDWKLDPSRVHVLPLSVDTDYYRPAPVVGTVPPGPSVLFVGRLDHRKNVLSLLHA
ncbi:MAG: glycosyltransferase, partial [Thermoplasmata archaeon]|nr:glycosyltransferase [Thermoplasmata archaeon]